MNGGRVLLKSVSRSFFLSINFLPGGMKEAVSVAYMLARAADSVADTAKASSFVRLDLLRLMDRVVTGIADRDECRRCFERLGRDLAPGQTHEGERVLLQRYGECVAAMNALPAEQISLIRKVLHTIVEGQIWDLEFFGDGHEGTTRTPSKDDVLLYTYRVAGCVGEFWTELASLVLDEHFSVLSREEMLELGRHYGQGLQLVNILRDRAEDASRGRSYISDEPDVLAAWQSMARSWLGEGVAYSSALINKRLRFASVLPAWLGLETMDLDGILDGTTASEPKKKVGRSVVRRLMVRAFLFAWKSPQGEA